MVQAFVARYQWFNVGGIETILVAGNPFVNLCISTTKDQQCEPDAAFLREKSKLRAEEGGKMLLEGRRSMQLEEIWSRPGAE